MKLIFSKDVKAFWVHFLDFSATDWATSGWRQSIVSLKIFSISGFDISKFKQFHFSFDQAYLELLGNLYLGWCSNVFFKVDNKINFSKIIKTNLNLYVTISKNNESTEWKPQIICRPCIFYRKVIEAINDRVRVLVLSERSNDKQNEWPIECIEGEGSQEFEITRK